MANRSIEVRDKRTRRPILLTGSLFDRMSLSKVRSEIESACAASRLLNSICSGMFVSVLRDACECTVSKTMIIGKDRTGFFLGAFCPGLVASSTSKNGVA